MLRVLTYSLLVLGLARVGHAQTPACAEPNVLIVLDVSGSMGGAGNPDSKYNKAVAAITAVTAAHDDRIRFGLVVFPAPGLEADGFGRCSVSTELAVDPALGTAAAIASYLDPTGATFFGGPKGYFDTPLVQALGAVVGLAAVSDPARRNFVLLISDGSQDCCAAGDYDAEPDCNPGEPYGSANYFVAAEFEENRADAVQGVANLFADGVSTFVVGFGTGVDALTLNQLAGAGGTMADDACDPLGAATTCYYSASDTATLSTALDAIAQIVREETCDALDNDCDGVIDEDLHSPCATDCEEGLAECELGAWVRCDAADPEPEQCDGEDNDCDGTPDDALTRACESACGSGVETCTAGAWGGCTAPAVPAETCDGLDNDCDGVPDDHLERACANDCDDAGVETCLAGHWGDCTAPAVPAETCDGDDNDCDGTIDEGCDCVEGETRGCGTNVGVCVMGVETCDAGAWGECDATEGGDEACNGLDDDCDGGVDEAMPCGEGGCNCGAPSVCACGTCAPPCGADDACPSGGTCMDGHCVTPACETGRECDGQACIDPDATDADDDDDSAVGEDGGDALANGAADDGCGCAGATPADTALGFLVLALFTWRRRRF